VSFPLASTLYVSSFVFLQQADDY